MECKINLKNKKINIAIEKTPIFGFAVGKQSGEFVILIPFRIIMIETIKIKKEGVLS